MSHCEETDYGILIYFPSGHAHIHFRSYEEMVGWIHVPEHQYYMERLTFTDFTTNTLYFGLKELDF